MAEKKATKKAAPRKASKAATTGKAATKKPVGRNAPAKKPIARQPVAKKVISSIDRELPDWRAQTLARMRRLIQDAVPDVVEEAKWKKPSNPLGVPTWSHDGILCTGETYKDRVKLTFAKGAFLKDPARLFNASLEGNLRRAIDIREGDKIDEDAFKTLVRAAAALNESRAG